MKIKIKKEIKIYLAFLSALFLISLVFYVATNRPEYRCPNGEIVSKADQCPEITATPPITTLAPTSPSALPTTTPGPTTTSPPTTTPGQTSTPTPETPPPELEPTLTDTPAPTTTDTPSPLTTTPTPTTTPPPTTVPLPTNPPLEETTAPPTTPQPTPPSVVTVTSYKTAWSSPFTYNTALYYNFTDIPSTGFGVGEVGGTGSPNYDNIRTYVLFDFSRFSRASLVKSINLKIVTDSISFINVGGDQIMPPTLGISYCPDYNWIEEQTPLSYDQIPSCGGDGELDASLEIDSESSTYMADITDIVDIDQAVNSYRLALEFRVDQGWISLDSTPELIVGL